MAFLVVAILQVLIPAPELISNLNPVAATRTSCCVDHHKRSTQNALVINSSNMSSSAKQNQFQCSGCDRPPFKSWAALQSHIKFCGPRSVKRRRQRFNTTKPRRTLHSYKRSLGTHSTHKATVYENAFKRRVEKNQDRAVTYTTTALHRHPNRDERAQMADEERMFREVQRAEEEARARAEAEADEEMEEPNPAEADDDIESDPADEEESYHSDLEFGGGDDAFDEDAGLEWNDEDEAGWEDIEEDHENMRTEEWNKPDPRWDNFRHGYGGVKFHEPYKYRNNLPPYYIAQLSLMHILSKHRNNDLSLFDRIMGWVGHFSDMKEDIWSTRKNYLCHTRESTLTFFSKFFRNEGDAPRPLKPDQVNVECSRARVHTVAVNDFERTLANMLTDPAIMRDENFIQDRFDKDTLRPTFKYEDMGDDDIIDDLHTGYLYHRGIELYAPEGQKPPPGIDMIVPCPLVAYTDEASTDRTGKLSTEPLHYSLAFLNADARARYENTRNMAYLPNTGVGHGTNYANYDDEWVENGKVRGQKTVKDTRTSKEKCTDYQNMYRVALKSLAECCDRGGVRVVFKGKKCLFKPFLLLCITDSKGANTICCHYNSNGNKNVHCLCKDCKCTFDQLVSTTPSCVRITRKDLKRALEDPDYAKRISHHPIPSAWNEIPLAEIIEGMNGSLPLEALHVHGHGTYLDGAESLRNYLGLGDTHKAEKEALDILFQTLAFDIERNAHKGYPRFSNSFGVTDLTRVTGTERKGNYLVLLLCLVTERGKKLFADLGDQKIVDVITTMTYVLAFDHWCYAPKTKWELDNAEAAVSYMMDCIINHLPREVIESSKDKKTKGQNGYHKIKFHAIWLFLNYMRKYGAARNFDGGPGEEHHKWAAKLAGLMTQRRASSFAYQCACRDTERTLIEQIYKYVQHLCPDESTRNLYTTTQAKRNTVVRGEVAGNDIVSQGQYSLTISNNPRQQQYREADFVLQWKDEVTAREGVGICDDLKQGLVKYTQQKHIMYFGQISLEGYTELRVETPVGNTTYRAHESYMGVTRNDWALIEDPIKSTTYIGKISGFIRYKTPGYPTYKLVKMDGFSPEQIAEENMEDDTLYVVFRASVDFFAESHAEMNSDKYTDEERKKKKVHSLSEYLATPFELQPKDTSYIFPISSIKKALTVVTDYGSHNTISYIHVLHQHEWGGIFSDLIRELVQPEIV